MLRRILAVIAGCVVAMAVIFLVESISHRFSPPPVGTDFKNPESLKHMMDNVPTNSFILLLGGYILGSFAGGLTATLLSGRNNFVPATVVGGILTAGGIMDLVQIPHPLWFSAISLLLYVPFALLGYLAVRTRTAN